MGSPARIASRCLLALAGAALAVCALARAGTSSGAVRPWRQSRFLIGGWGVNQAPWQPAQFVSFAAAGLDFLQESDHAWWLGDELRAARALDSLRVHGPRLRLQLMLHSAGANDP